MIHRRYTGFLFNQADDQGNGASGNAGGNGTDGKTGNSGNEGSSGGRYDDPEAYATALEKRLAERDAEREKLKTDLQELAQLREFREKRLKEEGNFEALLKEEQARLAELNPKAEAYDKLVEEMREQNKARIDALPAEQKALVSKLTEHMSPPALQAWLNDAVGVLSKPKPGSLDGGRGVEDFSLQTKVTEEDRAAAEIAKSQGYDISAEDIAKRRTGQT